MANKNGKPPVPSKESLPLQGGTEFRVVTLGLQEVVREYLDKGWGVNRIARELNEGVLADSNVKISGMAILRWSKENYSEDQRQSGAAAINLYTSYVEMLNSLSKQVEIQETIIDDLSKESAKSIGDIVTFSKALNASTTNFEKLLSRKQVLLQTIGGIQDKIYGYMAASEIVELTLGAVKAKDLGLYTEIMGQLRENSEYMELFRKIAPEK